MTFTVPSLVEIRRETAEELAIKREKRPRLPGSVFSLFKYR